MALAMTGAGLLLLAHGACTWTLVGLIWTVQLVHYPSFRYVGEQRITAFEVFHQRRITYLVAPLMLLEAATGALLLWWRPIGVPMWALVAGVVAIGLIWLSTFTIQVPLHRRLSEGYREDAITRLVRTNWIRTVAWTFRGGLMAWCIAQAARFAESSP